MNVAHDSAMPLLVGRFAFTLVSRPQSPRRTCDAAPDITGMAAQGLELALLTDNWRPAITIANTNRTIAVYPKSMPKNIRLAFL